MTELEKLKILTGEKDEELLQILLEDAEAFVLSYTNRTHLVSGLDKAVRDLAVIALNRGRGGAHRIRGELHIQRCSKADLRCAEPVPAGKSRRENV